ncbi:MAG TPA: hypothetical protein VJV05_04985 [Pyrinomonadaceae bacterium]|nr:hypothetical protein [Pyrinomonadaceae bacterium]
MFNKLVLLFAVVAIFTVAPAFAAPSGCNKIKFQGTYTRAAVNQDVLGDATVFHSWVFQLEIRADGTAAMNSSAYYDFMINTGSNSPGVGNWTCRADGKLVVSLLAALVYPIPPNTNPQLPSADISVEQHIRTTYLFSVDDVNTLTQIQSRGRFYGATEDPTNPAGGTLGALSTTQRVYTRFTASDADLLLP